MHLLPPLYVRWFIFLAEKPSAQWMNLKKAFAPFGEGRISLRILNAHFNYSVRDLVYRRHKSGPLNITCYVLLY